MDKRILAVFIAPSLLLMGCPAFAADTPEVAQLREQLRSTVLQLRQLQDQVAATPAPAPTPAPAAADTASKAKLAAAQSELRSARARADELQASLTKVQAQNDALTGASAAQAAELDKYKQAYTQATDAGRDLTAQRDQLKAQLGVMTNVSAACQAKNERLIAFAEGVLAADRKVGFGQVLSAKEPVLGLRRVQLENLAQEREDTVRANHCDPRLDAVAKPQQPPRPQGG